MAHSYGVPTNELMNNEPLPNELPLHLALRRDNPHFYL